MLRRVFFPSLFKSSAIFFAVVTVGLVMAACSSDSPTAPTQPQTPIGGSPVDAFSVTLSATPNTASANGEDTITIIVNVRNSATGAIPENGASVVLESSLGTWTDTSGQAIALGLAAGQAKATLSSTQDGSGQVRAEFAGAVATIGYVFGNATVFVNSVTPNTGNPNGGETVQIRGGGFDNPATVTFDGNSAQVLSINPSVMRVLTPAANPIDLGGESSLTVDIEITSGLGTNNEGSASLVGAFSYTTLGIGDNPVISSLTPSSGPNEGGTVVRILGNNFEAPVEVTFGDTTRVQANVLSVTSREITVETPPATGLGATNQNSAVTVTVKNINTGREGSRAAIFTYGPPLTVTAVQPAQGSPFGGDQVTILGSGFAEPLIVDVAGVRATIVSVTESQIVVTTGEVTSTGCADVSDEVVVTNTSTGLVSSGGPDFNYQVSQFAPTLTGMSPNSGFSTGGATVTLSGSRLDRPLVVRFQESNGQSIAGTVLSQTATSASVRTPGWPDSSLDVTTCDDNMDMIVGEKYLATPVDVQVEDTGTGCQSTITGLFTYTPSNGSCRGD